MLFMESSLQKILSPTRISYAVIRIFSRADFELSIATDHISFLAATTVSAAACKLLWVGSSCLKTMQEMGPQSALNSSRALDGVHGVYVLPHAPFVVEEVKELGDQSSTCKNSNSGNHRYLLMQRVQQHISTRLKPVHCCLTGDQNFAETVANVVTSLPFIALGVHAPRKNLNTKLYANSLIGVGVASSVYHSSRGRIRKFMRWVDYTMIATATVCLSRALRSEHPKLLMAVSAVFLPFQPLMVSVVHTGLMEVAFSQRALKDPELRMAHNVHKACSLLGGVLFVADDVFPETPFIHAAWHLAAAAGVGTCNKLLE